MVRTKKLAGKEVGTKRPADANVNEEMTENSMMNTENNVELGTTASVQVDGEDPESEVQTNNDQTPKQPGRKSKFMSKSFQIETPRELTEVVDAAPAAGEKVTSPTEPNAKKAKRGKKVSGDRKENDHDNEDQSKAGRKQLYASEEERRKARLLKNRRTAEESRQRRLQKMKELEAENAGFVEREKKLKEDIIKLRAELAAQVVEINNLKAKLNEKPKK
mmetsp:Transcript_619/g.1113  ORF Transcript_619/g.1113 Transcript_619/m.1113 type:complete len:219 (+) Transcript_619:64-720(+)